AWLILMATYGWTLWRARGKVVRENWIERGIVLGAVGGLLGFMTSGVVHYNWGDSEVVMILYLIMGLSLVVERQAKTTVGQEYFVQAATSGPRGLRDNDVATART